MPANPNKPDQLARSRVDKIINECIINKKQAINYNQLLKEISISFPVSIASIERFINRFYISDPYVPVRLSESGDLEFSEECFVEVSS